MNDKVFKQAIKKVEKQFGKLTMEELGILWSFYSYLKDEKPKTRELSGWSNPIYANSKIKTVVEKVDETTIKYK